MTNTIPPHDLWETLSPELSTERRNKVKEVLSQRTRHVTLVLQDVNSEHNICACLRSAEAFGVQEVHIINEKKDYRISTVAKGSSSWLTIHNHRTIKEAAISLKSSGYQLLAALPKQDSVPLEEITVEKPLALVFGNEHSGISKDWDPFIDIYFTIPMFGFVESLNISVSAAITMQSLTSRSRMKLKESSYFLSESQKSTLLNKWAEKKIPHALKKYKHLTS